MSQSHKDKTKTKTMLYRAPRKAKCWPSKSFPYFRTREVYWALWWWMWLPISSRWMPGSALNSEQRQSSSVERSQVAIHPQIPFSQIKLPPQVHRFTMQPPHRRRDEKDSSVSGRNNFNKKSLLFNYLLFGVGQQCCLLNRGSNRTNPRLRDALQ